VDDVSESRQPTEEELKDALDAVRDLMDDDDTVGVAAVMRLGILVGHLWDSSVAQRDVVAAQDKALRRIAAIKDQHTWSEDDALEAAEIAAAVVSGPKEDWMAPTEEEVRALIAEARGASGSPSIGQLVPELCDALERELAQRDVVAELEHAIWDLVACSEVIGDGNLFGMELLRNIARYREAVAAVAAVVAGTPEDTRHDGAILGAITKRWESGELIGDAPGLEMVVSELIGIAERLQARAVVSGTPERPTRFCGVCGHPSVSAYAGGWKCRDCGAVVAGTPPEEQQ
jgi:hypothetical protein